MKINIFLITACIVSYIVLFFLVCNKKPCPEIRTGIDTVSIVIEKHDTVTVEKTREKIVVRRVPVIQYQRMYDTVSRQVEIESVADTENCYSIENIMNDGAHVRADMCSRYFPVSKPVDLRADIYYVSPPDTVRTITLTDSVMVKPSLWRGIKIAGVWCGIGITAGIVGTILIGR